MNKTIPIGVALALLPATAFTRAPPLPVYDGCVLGAEVRIVTGPKRVLDKNKKPLDLSAYKGKRIRFTGYLQRDPVLVMLDEKPTVLGACRPTPHLPRSAETIDQALAQSRKRPTSKAGTPDGPCLAAVVKATSAPLHSGEIDGRQLLSNDFALVESLAGPWPKTFKLSYTASVADNERAVKAGETILVIPVEDKRMASLHAGKILENSGESAARLRATLKTCK